MNTWTYLTTFNASSGIFILVTTSAVNFIVFGDERSSADWIGTNNANETILVPLVSFVLHFFHS